MVASCRQRRRHLVRTAPRATGVPARAYSRGIAPRAPSPAGSPRTLSAARMSASHRRRRRRATQVRVGGNSRMRPTTSLSGPGNARSIAPANTRNPEMIAHLRRAALTKCVLNFAQRTHSLSAHKEATNHRRPTPACPRWTRAPSNRPIGQSEARSTTGKKIAARHPTASV
jgi:hypothetical protein